MKNRYCIVNFATRSDFSVLTLLSSSIQKILLEEKQIFNNIDVIEYNMPFFRSDNKEYKKSFYYQEMYKKICSSNRYIFIFQEYHASFSSSIKCFLEWIDKDIWYLKYCFLISCCGGQNSFNAINALFPVLIRLKIFIFPFYFVLSNIEKDYREEKKICLKKKNYIMLRERLMLFIEFESIV